MTKTGFQNIAPEQQEIYDKCYQTGDPFLHSNVIKHAPKQGTLKGSATASRSEIKACAELWAGLSDPEKQEWANTSPYSSGGGWRHFFADTSLRIKAGIPGVHTPNINYQVRIGQIISPETSEVIRLSQYHPGSYYIKTKKPGYQRKYRPVRIQEKLERPFEMAISMRYVGEMPSEVNIGTLKALIFHDYQGHSLTYEVKIDLVSYVSWTRATGELPNLLGEIKDYQLELELTGFQGTFEFDRIEAIHHSQNWVIDSQCDEINANYLRGLCQCTPPWMFDEVPEGVTIRSKYHS